MPLILTRCIMSIMETKPLKSQADKPATPADQKQFEREKQKRLTEALRANLKKRKEQMRGRSKISKEKE